MKYLRLYQLLFILLLFHSFSGCKKEETEEVVSQTGRITLKFTHLIDGNPIRFDTMMYVNEAGNHYLVNEIQYIMSNITFHGTDDNAYILKDWSDVHYVDTDIPSTQTWEVYDLIPAKEYDRISFTFGMDELKNVSLMFVNPPESFMFWPEYLGGGYHYMKLNGKWLDANQQISPFDFHLGIGQIYNSSGEIIEFVQNYYIVEIPNSSFTLLKDQMLSIGFVMNVENWFLSPHTYDHDDWGSDIMQNQAAMHLACENGWDVFSIGPIEELKVEN